MSIKIGHGLLRRLSVPTSFYNADPVVHGACNGRIRRASVHNLCCTAEPVLYAVGNG